MIRKPTVAGQFYPADCDELESVVRGFLTPDEKVAERVHARAVIAPHAGYIYSGGVAGTVYSHVLVPDDVILIGPNHTGLGPGVSVMRNGTWEVPSGKAEVNGDLASAVLAGSDLLKDDVAAHMMEHSLEVQLPFLLAMNPDVSIVPITVMRADYEDAREIGRAIATAIRGYGSEVLIAVSSDMNHYESDETTRKKDRLAIERVTALDPKGLLEVTSAHEITMCGVLPTAIAIEAALALGATTAELVGYATSAEASGDYSHVVGYAGFLIR